MTERHLSPVHLDEPPPDGGDSRLPPQDFFAEQCVLGSMLISRRAITDVLEAVQPGDYYRPHHELIHDTITHLHAAGEPVDAITVADELGKRNVLARVGGQAYLHTLIQAVPTAANAGYYADIVHERAAMRRLVEAGTRIVQLGYGQGEGDVEDLYTRADDELRTARARVTPADPAATTWSPLPLDDILDQGDIVEQPAILPRTDGHCLLYRGAVHSIAGEPESGKTWLALLACADELRKGEHVTYVDFEDRPGRVVGRLLALGAPRTAIRDRFHYIRPNEALSPASATLLDDVAVTSTLVVLDGITEAMSLHGLDLNAQEDVARFLLMLPRRLADLGPAVAQIDHVVKNAEQHNRFAIGAQHKLAGLDGAAYMVKVLEPFARGKVGRARITVVKDREGAVREHASGHTAAELLLDSTATLGALRASLEAPAVITRNDDTGQMRPTHLMEEVSKVVEATPGMSATQIEKLVEGRTTYVRLAIKTLVVEGYITTESGPRGAVFHHCDHPYREADDDLR